MDAVIFAGESHAKIGSLLGEAILKKGSMIKKLKLKNWRSHLDSEFSFSEGVNALIGIMGSGKTSVLQAISFALFGNFPQLQSKKLKLEDMIMKKPHKKDKAEIELDFHANGKDYSIKRVIEQQKAGAKTTYAEVRENGAILDVTPQGVTRVVENILQTDYNLFSKAIYSEQDGLDAFLRLPKGQRMEQIDRMLKLDRYEIARENAVSLTNKIKDRKEEKAKILSDLEKEGIENKVSDLERDVNEMSAAVYTLRAEHKIVSGEKAKLESEILDTENKQRELNEARKRLEGFLAGLKEINLGIEQRRQIIQGASNLPAQFENINKQINFLENDLRESRKNEKKISESIASFRANIFNLERRVLPELELKISKKEQHMAAFRNLKAFFGEDPDKVIEKHAGLLEKEKKEIYAMQARRFEIEQNLKHLAAKKKCPVCDTVITPTKKKALVKQREKEIWKIENEMDLKKSVIGDLERNFDSLNKKLKELEVLKERVGDLEELKKNLESGNKQFKDDKQEQDNYEKSIVEVEKKTDRLEAGLGEAQKIRERIAGLIREAKILEELVEKKKQYENNIVFLQETEKGLSYQLERVDLRVLRKVLEEKIAKEREVFIKISALQERIADKGERLSELKVRQDVLIRYKEETKRDEEIVNNLTNFVKVLKITQNQLREEFITTVNYIMGVVWPEIYPYGDLESVRLIIDEDYVLQIKEAGGWTSIDVVSGGERSLAVLALRIAFSLAFTPHLKWLILDEPTHNLDVNAIHNFAEILRERINQFAKQVFLITHEDRICEGITGNIYRLERDKEANGATVVVGM